MTAATRDRLVRLAAAVPSTVVVALLARTTSSSHAWIAAALAALVVVGAGYPVLRGAARHVCRGRLHVDVLVAAGSLGALGYSLWALTASPPAHALHDGWGHAHLEIAPLIVALVLVVRAVDAGLPSRSRGARCRRVSVRAIVLVTVLVPLALGPGRSLLPAQHVDLSRRLPAGNGLSLSVDVLAAHAGTNTLHVYLLDDGGLVGMTDLRVSGRLIQFADRPPVSAVVEIGMSGFGHFSGVITLRSGYWLIELDGVSVDGRTFHAAMNAQID